MNTIDNHFSNDHLWLFFRLTLYSPLWNHWWWKGAKCLPLDRTKSFLKKVHKVWVYGKSTDVMSTFLPINKMYPILEINVCWADWFHVQIRSFFSNHMSQIYLSNNADVFLKFFRFIFDVANKNIITNMTQNSITQCNRICSKLKHMLKMVNDGNPRNSTSIHLGTQFRVFCALMTTNPGKNCISRDCFFVADHHVHCGILLAL